MKKQQAILLGSALILLLLLLLFGKTIPAKKNVPAQIAKTEDHSAVSITTADLVGQAKTKLSPSRYDRITKLENSVVRGNVKEQQIAVYKQLASFWGDSIHNHQLGAYYIGEAAKLENSEKNLTFAAHLLLDDLMAEEDAALQNWLATNAKSLFEKALEINPSNDSSKVGRGACYLFGNIADNPMEGIMIIRKVVENNPDNIYAQMMLGLGGIRSGQYDKAIERFLIVIKKHPDNLEAVFRLAETYDRKEDKANAIKWYTAAGKMINTPEARNAIEERIKILNKQN